MTEKKRQQPAWMRRVGRKLDPEILIDARRVMIIVMAFGCYGWTLSTHRWAVFGVLLIAVVVWFLARSLELASDQNTDDEKETE